MRHRLPDGASWEVIFDEVSGDGVAFDPEGTMSSILLDQVFDNHLCRAADGSLWLESCSKATGEAVYLSFTEKQMKYVCLDVSLPTLGLGANVFFETYGLVVRKQSFAYFWSALQLYRVLKLATYKGIPSKWASTSRQNWMAWMADAGLEPNDHVLPSALAGQQGQQQPAPTPTPRGFLPAPSLSTAGRSTATTTNASATHIL
eukprot:14900217-Heterocapsa_arctica.AAC.1